MWINDDISLSLSDSNLLFSADMFLSDYNISIFTINVQRDYAYRVGIQTKQQCLYLVPHICFPYSNITCKRNKHLIMQGKVTPPRKQYPLSNQLNTNSIYVRLAKSTVLRVAIMTLITIMEYECDRRPLIVTIRSNPLSWKSLLLM